MGFGEVDNQQEKEIDSNSIEGHMSSSCGAILFAERKRQNLDVEYIAKQINLSVAQIRALESDKYDMLASSSYVKGYIRLYANLLGLESDKVLQCFKEPAYKQTTSLSNIGMGIHKTKRANTDGLKLFLYALIFAGVCAVVWKVLKTDEQSTQEQAQNVSELTDKSESIQGQSSNTSTLNLPINKGSQKLSISFSGSTWVEIIDKNNHQVVNNSYNAGENISIYVQPPLRIFISNVDAVNMQYNQVKYDLAPYKRNVFAKFKLD